MLLARPTAPQIETVNDLDCYLANFWRCLSALSMGCDYAGRSGDEIAEEVASFADWPVNEADLHARHRWLVEQGDFRERMRRDPHHYDARIAGWWVWGLCAWIGSGWCDVERGGGAVQIVDLHCAGQGVNAKAMRDVNSRLPHIGAGGSDGKSPTVGRGVHSHMVRSALHETFARLAARLRYVRVACGDWRRVLTDSVTWRHGTTGILLDPEYIDGADVYAHSDAGTGADHVWHQAAAWAAEHGSDKRLRIALCGYDGNWTAPAGWTVEAWKAKGGYGGQRKKAKGGEEKNENAGRERIWFSPGCMRARQGDLFG